MTEHLPAAPRTGRAAARVPQPPRLQLATYVDEPPVGDEWVHEIKFDGYRVAATLHRGRARLTTRNLLDWTERFAHVAEAVAQLPAGSAVLDGEVVALGSDNRSDFGALQRWLSANTSNGVSGVDLSRYTIVYQVFDLLHLDGSDLRSSPLERRKELLRELLARAEPALVRESGSGGRSSAASSSPQTVVRYTDHLTSSGPDVYRAACRLGLEGVVSKRLGSPYTEGRAATGSSRPASRRATSSSAASPFPRAAAPGSARCSSASGPTAYCATSARSAPASPTHSSRR